MAKSHITEPDTSAALPKSAHLVYVWIVGLVFIALAVVFMFFPRPKYSELEKRDLATFPDLSTITTDPAKLTADISSWFSDSEPYRDLFMNMSMNIRSAMSHSFRDDENVLVFHDTGDDDLDRDHEAEALDEGEGEAKGNPMADENAKVANKGIVVIGKEPNVRAVMVHGGTPTAVQPYINTLNEYAETFPDITFYPIIAPTAGGFYLPDRARDRYRDENAVLEAVKQGVRSNVKYVDVRNSLAAHTDEPIYSRTDHHWAPLGAYYAAKAFARTAGVPFKELDRYDKHVVHGYVGSMYGYSKDIAVKNSPEDFIYYTPKGLNYETTYVNYSVDKDYNVTAETAPFTGSFFKSYPDGSGGAYCAFMGGDHFLVHVKTGTPSNRRLLIVKDSYGNAVPGYLFYSFSDIHVVDFRYFKRNIKEYIRQNGITDIAFAFSAFNICNSNTFRKVKDFLTQGNGVSSSTKAAPSESDKPDKKEEKKKEDKKAKESTSKPKEDSSAKPAGGGSETPEPSEPKPAPEPAPEP